MPAVQQVERPRSVERRQRVVVEPVPGHPVDEAILHARACRAHLRRDAAFAQRLADLARFSRAPAAAFGDVADEVAGQVGRRRERVERLP
ncbi:hypothetical protein [Burkholderia sp. LMG 32019]|uniref:hypothetical protein n=1 Tax=Burkholderia sp. LMG 32019 TaxID=3158173 RepID=UPI003C3049F8